MPYFDFNYWTGATSYTLTLPFQAIMLFPNDLEARKQMLAVEVVSILNNDGSYYPSIDDLVAAHTPPAEMDEDKKKQYIVEITQMIDSELRVVYDLAGGEKTLFDSDKHKDHWKNLERYQTEGVLAGQILYRIMQMANEDNQSFFPSVKKAIFLADNFDRKKLKELDIPVNANYLKKNWTRYKPVAHIWAAYVFWRINGKKREFNFRESEDGLYQFLSLSEVFREFGESFIPHAQKIPLLNADEIWKQHPDQIEFKTRFTLPKLSNEERSALDKYRA